MTPRLEHHQSRAPLTTRPLDQILYRQDDGEGVSVGRFLRQAEALAAALPERDHVINLCQDRRWFMLGVAAALLRRQITLLPPNRQPATLQDCRQRFGSVGVLRDHPADPHDSAEDTADGLDSEQALDLRSVSLPRDAATVVPSLDLDQLCVIGFTSGSTGSASTYEKHWRTLHYGAAINTKGLLQDAPTPARLLATVPGQHMYGFETTVALPWLAALELSAARPLFPEDIRRALQALAPPRILISTPVHLRAMVRSGVDFPAVELVLSATAPLDRALALEVTDCLSATVRDVYGFSEAGCVATRELVHGDHWTLMPGFERQGAADERRLGGHHLSEAVPLQDRIEWLDQRRFRLLGRHAEWINIAGKRASLASLNQSLLAVPGVEDGVIFEPEPEARRLAALVVAPGLQRSDLRQALRRHLDPVFLPRPLVLVNALPRNATGKLPRADLLACLRQHRADSPEGQR